MAAGEQVRVLNGQCLCGSVRLRISGPVRPVVACHCNECRRFTGSFWTATAARRENIAVNGEPHMSWFALHPHARRGFCSRCGSSLLFDPLRRDDMAIAAGCLDKPTGLGLRAHIWTREGGDYYCITDGLPQHEDSSHGLRIGQG